MAQHSFSEIYHFYSTYLHNKTFGIRLIAARMNFTCSRPFTLHNSVLSPVRFIIFSAVLRMKAMQSAFACDLSQ